MRKGAEGISVDLHGPKIDGLPDHGLAAAKQLAEKTPCSILAGEKQHPKVRNKPMHPNPNKA